MTQTNNKLFDEFAKLMTDASGVAQGMRREVETMVRGQAERFLADMDIVRREDFDAAMELAANARKEADGLAERVGALEARVAELEGKGAAPKKPAKKPAAKAAGKA
ncbi:BMFP domain-containing protein YqiC [Rhodobium orientis]|uniref:Pyrroline-5-carboxylate reductase n=1 Tax=Rhodobium orientis TaxID=34017 RepID=A0A327JYK8_9HYPH|nr:accessory factor UbiK family protein [Rhodobium orientis]MBB4301177.1 BMFP domain-containing protein YqiC [Rhodobium orientis]MBK5949812.1 pyrroline-5-carboxylate reductase [Rhodobium orientis]RAI30052.1 pyrroline-5-carboxylate reductase [Rhodobium orientis]